MRSILIKLYLISLLISASCFAAESNVLSTDYKHRTFFRGGYHDSKIASDIFQVTFEGNEFTSKQLTIKYALIRAAEVTKNNGGSYFVIVDKLDDSSSINPHPVYRFWSFPYRSYSLDNWVEYFAFNSIASLESRSPSLTLTIKVFKKKPDSGAYLVASDILEANADILDKRGK